MEYRNRRKSKGISEKKEVGQIASGQAERRRGLTSGWQVAGSVDRVVVESNLSHKGFLF